MLETNTIEQILYTIFMIAWPLLHAAIAIAGVLLFRAEKRHFNLCITIGAALAFLSSIAHLMYFSQAWDWLIRAISIRRPFRDFICSQAL